MNNKIKYYRLEKGLSLNDLSYITGLSVSYICRLENGGRENPSFFTMSKIATALNKNITDVFLY